MPSSAGCLRLEPEKVMVMCQQLGRHSFLSGAVSSDADAVADAKQCSRTHCCSAQSCCSQESHGWAQTRVRRAPGWEQTPMGLDGSTASGQFSLLIKSFYHHHWTLREMCPEMFARKAKGTFPRPW